MKIENKVIVVTGGSGGIGYALARGFISENAKVVIIIDINFDNYVSKYQNIIPKVCDVTDEKVFTSKYFFTLLEIWWLNTTSFGKKINSR